LLQQGAQLGNVEAYDSLPVNQRDRRGHVAKLFELSQRALVRGDVTISEGNLVLGKKLFHLAAEDSTALAVDDDLLAHEKSSND
jgi:hypothetical protein